MAGLAKSDFSGLVGYRVLNTLTENSQEYALSSVAAFAQTMQQAEALTAVYRQHEDRPIAGREAAVLARQFPHMFQAVEPGDVMAGRVRYPLVGLSPQQMGLGYYCAAQTLRKGASNYPEFADRVESLIAYWAGRTTEEKCRATLPCDAAKHLPSDAWFTESGVGFPLYRIGGSTLDYGKLVALGLDGLEAETRSTQFAHVAPLLRDTIDRYLTALPNSPLADSLRAIRHDRPRTYRDAVQLIWLYALHAGSWNYGRLDIVLGPLLMADLAEHRTTWDDALDFTCGGGSCRPTPANMITAFSSGEWVDRMRPRRMVLRCWLSQRRGGPGSIILSSRCDPIWVRIPNCGNGRWMRSGRVAPFPCSTTTTSM